MNTLIKTLLVTISVWIHFYQQNPGNCSQRCHL